MSLFTNVESVCGLSAEVHALENNSWLFYIPGFLDYKEADMLFSSVLTTADWKQRPSVFNTMQPRLTAAFGTPGIDYKYSQSSTVAQGWTMATTVTTRKVQQLAEALHQRYPLGPVANYNYILANRYRNEKDSVAWHSDNEQGMWSTIGSLSLGDSRTFSIRPIRTDSKFSMALNVRHGDLVVMAGEMQKHYRHAVLKCTSPKKERINLTFRSFEV